MENSAIWETLSWPLIIKLLVIVWLKPYYVYPLNSVHIMNVFILIGMFDGGKMDSFFCSISLMGVRLVIVMFVYIKCNEYMTNSKFVNYAKYCFLMNKNMRNLTNKREVSVIYKGLSFKMVFGNMLCSLCVCVCVCVCVCALPRATLWEHLNNSTQWWPIFHQHCGGGGGGQKGTPTM